MKIISWCINVTWSNGKKEDLSDMPSHVAQGIDDWLTEKEDEDE